jgi:uncharacterized membrane protein YvbJ
MVYCSRCGHKNDDDAIFCGNCGVNLEHPEDRYKKDDDCVCESNNRNPLTPVFWGIVVILIGIFIIDQAVFNIFPIDFCGLILLIIAIAIILTGIRIATKKK